ncbi:hypothetical protein C0J52_04340 [Blattella germanica]|nr:hypothetical protein C0J52_04340 [Blattella germanica]
MLGFPVFGDQTFNARKVQIEKIGLHLSLIDITRELLLKSIKTVLKDVSFRNNVERLSAIFRDKPENSTEKVVWWTEYVLRHKGAEHLRSAAMDLDWYQYLLLDIIVFMILTIFVIIFILFHLFRIFYYYITDKVKVKCKYE